MFRKTGMLCIFLFAFSANAGPVYRCTGAGGVPLYTDKGCPGAERIEEETLQPNLFTGAPIAETRITKPRRTSSKATRKRSSGCNNADDLRTIDLMLNSLASDPWQKRFLKAERRRVKNCRLEDLSALERQKRDAALRRIRALRQSEREAAKTEIEDIYAAARQ